MVKFYHISGNKIAAEWLTLRKKIKENILRKQGMAVPTHAKFKAPAEAGAYKSLVRETSPNPFNTDFICDYASFRR